MSTYCRSFLNEGTRILIKRKLMLYKCHFIFSLVSFYAFQLKEMLHVLHILAKNALQKLLSVCSEGLRNQAFIQS